MVTERLGISTALRLQIRLKHESKVQQTQKAASVFPALHESQG